MDALKFFELMYGGAKGWMALWRRDTKRTEFVRAEDATSIEAFVDAANEQPFNAYFGVGLFGEKPTKGRGTEAGVTVIPGVWADIDFAAKDQSEKQNAKVYPTRLQAQEALTKLPRPPSIVFFTGGGIHAYWLFIEPLRLTDANRDDVKGVVQRWQGRLRTLLMKACGATIDSTHDLSRVMRIPGTCNVKNAETVTVTIDESYPLSGDVPRYALSELRLDSPAPAAAPAASAAPRASQAAPRRDLGLAVTATTEPNYDLIDNYCDAEANFRLTWGNRRDEFGSPSSYDQSLANFGVYAGWSDQQIGATILAFSRRHYPDRIAKVLRTDGAGRLEYLERTIGEARDKATRDRAASEKASRAKEAIAEISTAADAATLSGERLSKEAVCEQLSRIFDVVVVGFRQTGERDEVYELLVMHDGKRKAIEIGSAAKLRRTPDHLLDRLMAQCHKIVEGSKELRKKWTSIVTAMLAIVEYIEVEEATTPERVRAVIEEHLKRNQGPMLVETVSQRQQAAADSRPFIEDRKLYVNGTALKQVAASFDKAIIADLYVGLRALGFYAGHKVQFSGTSKAYWQVPASQFGLDAGLTNEAAKAAVLTGDDDE